MNNKGIKKIHTVVIGLISISFLVLTYYSKYFFAPCIILTIIDVILIRNMIDKYICNQDRKKLENKEKKCVIILLIILFLICGLMYMEYNIIYDIVIKLIVGIMVAILLIVCIFITYTVTSIQMQIIKNNK